jgi:uncharacterized protein YndB with AHSA1/START domain
MADTRTITIERVFDAPVEKVWTAWTDPAEVSKWWGPKGFTSPENHIDLQVGGKYVFVMQGPAGTEWDKPMYSGGEYTEVVPMKKLVYTDNFVDKDGNKVSPEVYGMPADFPQDLVVTLTFEEVDGKTKLTLTHEGMPAGDMGDQTEAGWNESLDKLAAAL